MGNEGLFWGLIAILGVAVTAVVQLALCILRPRSLGLLPTAALTVGWLWAIVEPWKTVYFLMAVIGPFAVLGIFFGWLLYSVWRNRKKH